MVRRSFPLLNVGHKNKRTLIKEIELFKIKFDVSTCVIIRSLSKDFVGYLKGIMRL